MTVQLSIGLRNKMLDGGVGGGFKGSLNLGFINVYSGPQPISADSAATGTLLGTVSVDGAGTGLTMQASAAGSISKTPTETWRFAGLADGTAGWARFYPSGGNPAGSSTTEARIDFAIGTANADLVISNMSVKVGIPCTIDTFVFGMPAK